MDARTTTRRDGRRRSIFGRYLGTINVSSRLPSANPEKVFVIRRSLPNLTSRMQCFCHIQPSSRDVCDRKAAKCGRHFVCAVCGFAKMTIPRTRARTTLFARTVESLNHCVQGRPEPRRRCPGGGRLKPPKSEALFVCRPLGSMQQA